MHLHVTQTVSLRPIRQVDSLYHVPQAEGSRPSGGVAGNPIPCTRSFSEAVQKGSRHCEEISWFCAYIFEQPLATDKSVIDNRIYGPGSTGK